MMSFDFFDTADSMAALQNDHDAPAPACDTDAAHSKKFHINDILSLYTGLPLTQEGSAALFRLAGFVMDDVANSEQTLRHLDCVKNCLFEQLAFLSDAGMDALQSICKMDQADAKPYLTVWLEMQTLRHGEEHAVMTYAAWQAQKSQDREAAAANNNQPSGKAASV